jgi:hypothetical protein
MNKSILILLFLTLPLTIYPQEHVETITITTYYPAPYGVYREMRSQRMAIGDNYYDPSQYYWEDTFPNIGSEADLIVEGNVGIGTTNPVFSLDISGDGGIIARGNYLGGPVLPSPGAGARLIWYPRKGAFRVGYASGTQWHDGNIGEASIAMGYNTVASGQHSISMGYSAVASGTYSTAMGYDTRAGGGFSTAMGRRTHARGDLLSSYG